MGRCTGRRCPMQVGYDVANCNQFDCIYRTEINTNYDRIKSMSVEEMAALITKLAFFPCELCERDHNASCTHGDCFEIHKQWLLQEVSEDE